MHHSSMVTRRQASSGVTHPDFADARIAEALLDAVDAWPQWCHRRVDSVHPLVGERGRVRHSLDCSPPPDPWLAYSPAEREHDDVAFVRGQVVLPLAIVEKAPMRQLDAVADDGRAIPLLSMSENVELASAMLEAALGKAGVIVDDGLARLLRVIAGPGELGSVNAPTIVETLVDTGAWNGRQYFTDRLPAEVTNLLHDLSRGFLLAGLIPAERAGVRQVVKISFHWRIEPAERRLALWWSRMLTSIRAVDREIELPMTAPSDTASYHLEFQTPQELDCTGLELPTSSGPSRPGMRDESGLPVAHVHGAFSIPPTGLARASLSVPRRGLWTYALLATAVTMGTIWGILALPGGMTAVRGSPEASAAVLLALPALLIGLAAGRRESALAAWMLGPLRLTMLTCSLILFLLGWTLVGKLQDPWHIWLWQAAAAVVTTLFLALVVVGPLWRTYARALRRAASRLGRAVRRRLRRSTVGGQ